MTLKRIALIGFIFVACLAGYLTLRTERVKTDPASSMAAFFLFRAHCPMPESTCTGTTPASHEDDPATAMGSLHLLQANVPF
jgi:hypothetical protein